MTTSVSDISLEEKILGCWMGKNCGGTLGGPHEKAYSEDKPFDVSFYTEIREGGIPNDDLEIQLIWLKALEEVGLNLTARDMAEYWLDHVGYNPDEYGLMMTNLRLGLVPPVAGYYNNFFKDCMGCPIRTEIWACIAPGNPRVAARYSLEDSIVDHAGGESIYGSLFNVAVESAAFVVHDPHKLIDIGLSYLPEKSLTARCIRAVVDAHAAGLDWVGARRKVLDIGYSINAQFSPPNIAFQVVGWLYGNDFGDALCKAVNCGYDTDCTGATLGSILGIIGGAKSLPSKWTAPLGDAIATSDPHGAKNLYLPPNPVPRTLSELTERTMRIHQQIVAKFGPAPTDIADLYADEEIKRLAVSPPTRVPFRLSSALHLDLDYGKTPQIDGNEEKQIKVIARHQFPENTPAVLTVNVPEGWRVHPARIQATLKPNVPWTGTVTVRAAARAVLANSNVAFFHLQPSSRSVVDAVPLVFPGSPVYLRSEIFDAAGKSAAELLDTVFPSESVIGALTEEGSRSGKWQVVSADGNDLGPCLQGISRGVTYLRGFLEASEERSVWFNLCSTVPAKVWINGEVAFASKQTRPLRPAAWGSREGELHGAINLKAGWNEILFKFASDEKTPAVEAHVLYSDKNKQFAGLTDLAWVRFPWDRS